MFADRLDAGRQLAQRLLHLREREPVVLGLPRGGVVVAAEVARELDAPLDVLVVRKLGAPGHEELAIGAIIDGSDPQTILNHDIVQALGVDDRYIAQESARQLQRVRDRQAMYRGGYSPVPVKGRCVIVIDDGIATGSTMLAAITSLRASGPSHLVLAVPVASPQAVRSLSLQVDEMVCLQSPAMFRAVGQAYVDFSETRDEEVIALLSELHPRSV